MEVHGVRLHTVIAQSETRGVRVRVLFLLALPFYSFIRARSVVLPPMGAPLARQGSRSSVRTSWRRRRSAATSSLW